jgi:hypothetical protein
MGGGVLLGLALAAGCGDDELSGPVDDDRVPNTYLTVGPAEGADVSYRVNLRWTTNTLPEASPAARAADRYEIAWEDTSEWVSVTSTDSIFFTQAAETCCVDPLPTYQTPLPDSVYSQPHAFFVRGLSPSGKRDPTPVSVRFTSHTIAPSTHVMEGPTHEALSCPDTPFEWIGIDPDGEIVSFQRALVSAFDYRNDPVNAGALPADDAAVAAWLENVVYRPDGAGGYDTSDPVWVPETAHSILLTGLPQTVSGVQEENRFWYALRAIDNAGATERVLEAGRNLIAFEVRDLASAGGPTLDIQVRVNGEPRNERWSTGDDGDVLLIGPNAGVRFDFVGLPTTECSVVTGYATRTDGGAFSDFGPSRRWPPNTEGPWVPGTEGIHTFTVRAIDSAGFTRDLTATIEVVVP